MKSILLILSLAVAAPALAVDFQIVVHEDNPLVELPRKELAKIFLRDARKWPDGTAALPVDRGDSAPVRESFSFDVHGRSARAVDETWWRRIYSGGKTPPKKLDSDAEVLAWVRARRGGVGYVTAGAELGEGVKVLRVL